MSVQHSYDNKSDEKILAGRIEKLKLAFKKYDKNLDDYIDFKELLDFLDTCMKGGKKFDRNLARDIFKILDLNGDKKVTVEEFLKTFLRIQETIENQIKLLETQINIEENRKKEVEFIIRENINEPINEENLSPNAKFNLEIINMEFIKETLDFDGIRIIVRFENDLKFTNVLKLRGDLIWKEKFEFNVKRKDDIIFEVINIDLKNNQKFQSLGIVRFFLGMIENQEEYDVVLEIPDANNENLISAKINAKIQFIWSFYKLYSEISTRTEENIYNLQLSLQKKRAVLNHLNEPLMLFELDEDIMNNKSRISDLSTDKRNETIRVVKNNKPQSNLNFDKEKNMKINEVYPAHMSNKLPEKPKSSKNIDDFSIGFTAKNSMQDKVIENIETIISRKIDTRRINWELLYRNLILTIILISLFVTPYKPDFLGIVLSIASMFLLLSKNQIEFIGKISILIKITTGILLYDISWILLNISRNSFQSFFGNQSRRKTLFIIYLLFVISFLLKIIYFLFLLIGRKKINMQLQIEESNKK